MVNNIVKFYNDIKIIKFNIHNLIAPYRQQSELCRFN